MQISPCTTSDQLSHPSYFSVNFKTVKNKTKTHVYWFISSAEAVQKKKKKSLEISKIVWSSNAKFLFQIYFLLIFI